MILAAKIGCVNVSIVTRNGFLIPHEKESNIKIIVYNNNNSVAKSIFNIASQVLTI